MDVGSDQRSVDNENNNQSRYSNISNIVQARVYIYESENIALGTRNISDTDWNTGKRCVQEGNTGMLCRNMETGTGTRKRTGTGTGTKVETVILRTVGDTRVRAWN